MKKVLLVMSVITSFAFKTSAQPYVHITAHPTACQSVDVLIYGYDAITCNPLPWKAEANVIPGNGTTTLDLGVGANWVNGTTPTGAWLTDWTIEEALVRNTCSQPITFGSLCLTNEYDVARMGIPINSCSAYPSSSCYEVTAGNTCNGCTAGNNVNITITYVAPDDVYIDIF